MFQKINNTIKWLTFFLITLILATVFLWIYTYVNDKTMKTLKNKGYVDFSVLIYDLGTQFNGRLDFYKVLYNKNTNVLKVLYVNSDTVAFRKNQNLKSFKKIFNENSKISINMAVDKFYVDLSNIIGKNAFSSDFYFSTSFKTIDFIMGYNKKLRYLLRKNFDNNDINSLNHFEIIKCILNSNPYSIIKVCRKYASLNTNIPKLALIALILRFKFLKPTLIFCEMPVKYTRNRLEPDKENIKEFFYKIYYADNNKGSYQRTERTVMMLVDVKNASKKRCMAEKIAWILRENKFDVIDWSNSSVSYDRTLIKDYKGNFKQALKIAEILKVGTVLVSYDNKNYADICVVLGEDCTNVL